jgi:hypothetical protein
MNFQGSGAACFEAKRTVAPRLTPLHADSHARPAPDSLNVIHAGGETFPLAKEVSAIGLARVLEDLPRIAP